MPCFCKLLCAANVSHVNRNTHNLYVDRWSPAKVHYMENASYHCHHDCKFSTELVIISIDVVLKCPSSHYQVRNRQPEPGFVVWGLT